MRGNTASSWTGAGRCVRTGCRITSRGTGSWPTWWTARRRWTGFPRSGGRCFIWQVGLDGGRKGPWFETQCHANAPLVLRSSTVEANARRMKAPYDSVRIAAVDAPLRAIPWPNSSRFCQLIGGATHPPSLTEGRPDSPRARPSRNGNSHHPGSFGMQSGGRTMALSVHPWLGPTSRTHQGMELKPLISPDQEQ